MTEIPLFDTHAHYDHPRFKEDGPAVVADLFSRGVIDGVVIPAISYESNFNRALFPEAQFSCVYFAAGLHPRFAVNEKWWTKAKRAEFAAVADDRRTVAIKTGLDFRNEKLTVAQKKHQERFFLYLAALAAEKSLPLVLHVREAVERLLELLPQAELPAEIAVHCFTSDEGIARRLLDAGVTRFGIGGMLTRPESGALRDCVKALPLSTLLLETDAPFVKPEGYEGKYNTSETLPEIVRLIAELKGLAVQTVAEAVQKNARDFFGLQPSGETAEL